VSPSGGRRARRASIVPQARATGKQRVGPSADDLRRPYTWQPGEADRDAEVAAVVADAKRRACPGGPMTDQELRDALDGLYAYDTGSADSGILDETLRRRCVQELGTRMAHEASRLFLSRLIRDMWLTEEALAQGYGIEDAVSFTGWLEDRMDVAVH
jgi:hypothetical protein